MDAGVSPPVLHPAHVGAACLLERFERPQFFRIDVLEGLVDQLVEFRAVFGKSRTVERVVLVRGLVSGPYRNGG